jgi:hypothetical protein
LHRLLPRRNDHINLSARFPGRKSTVIKRTKRFITNSLDSTKDVGSALFGVVEEDGALIVTAKMAAFTLRRFVYAAADYWLMGVSAALVIGLKAMDLEFPAIFLGLWVFDIVIAGAFLLFWQGTGIDLTLGNDFRRAVDEIHSKSRVAGMIAFLVVMAQATVWSGPEQVIIFFRREIGSRLGMLLVLLVLTGIQAIAWAAIYLLGYEYFVR